MEALLRSLLTKTSFCLPRSVEALGIDCLSTALRERNCSVGRITRLLGFSLGMKKASAFGVTEDSSSSAKNGTFPSDV
jgi:hypothetical protein